MLESTLGTSALYSIPSRSSVPQLHATRTGLRRWNRHPEYSQVTATIRRSMSALPSSPAALPRFRLVEPGPTSYPSIGTRRLQSTRAGSPTAIAARPVEPHPDRHLIHSVYRNEWREQLWQ